MHLLGTFSQCCYFQFLEEKAFGRYVCAFVVSERRSKYLKVNWCYFLFIVMRKHCVFREGYSENIQLFSSLQGVGTKSSIAVYERSSGTWTPQPNCRNRSQGSQGKWIKLCSILPILFSSSFTTLSLLLLSFPHPLLLLSSQSPHIFILLLPSWVPRGPKGLLEEKWRKPGETIRATPAALITRRTKQSYVLFCSWLLV